MEEDKKSWNFKRIFILARQLLKVLDQIGYLQMGQVTSFLQSNNNQSPVWEDRFTNYRVYHSEKDVTKWL